VVLLAVPYCVVGVFFADLNALSSRTWVVPVSPVDLALMALVFVSSGLDP
jgi:hypothetical protein